MLFALLRRRGAPAVEFNNRMPPKAMEGQVLPGFARELEKRPAEAVPARGRCGIRVGDVEFIAPDASETLRLAGRLTRAAALGQREGVRVGPAGRVAPPRRRSAAWSDFETSKQRGR